MIFCGIKNIKVISIYCLISSMYLNLKPILYLSIVLLIVINVVELMIRGKAKINKVAIVHLLFTCYVFISLFWADYQSGAWKASLISMCLVFIFSCYNFWRINEQETFFKALIIAGIFLALYVIKEFDLSSFQNRRVVLERINANEIACNLAISIFAIIFLKLKNKKKLKITDFFLMLFFLTVIVICRSKSGIIMLFLLSGSYYALSDLKRAGRRIIFFTALLLTFTFLLLNVEFLYVTIGYRLEGLVASLLLGAESEDTIRIELYKFGMQLFRRAPLFGQGIDQFRFINLEELDFIGGAHNNYLEILVDFGTIGFILYYIRYLFIWINLKGIHQHADKILILSLLTGMFFLDFTRVTYNFYLSQIILILISQRKERQIDGAS